MHCSSERGFLALQDPVVGQLLGECFKFCSLQVEAFGDFPVKFIWSILVCSLFCQAVTLFVP